MIVLLCDDHLLFTESLAHVLTGRGDTVFVTAEPGEAVIVAGRERPDVCAMDRSFPAGDVGAAGVRAVLDVSPETKILMLTGRSDAAGARAAVVAGARGFLKKDEPLDHVVRALDQVASGLLTIDAGVLRQDGSTGRRTSLLHTLTSREREVLGRMVNGQSGPAMASQMKVSYSTMRTHVQNSLVKLGVHSQLEATAYAVEHGLGESQVG